MHFNLGTDMFCEYIQAAMSKAVYEVIDDDGEPYYGEVPELKGVLANGKAFGRVSQRTCKWL